MSTFNVHSPLSSGRILSGHNVNPERVSKRISCARRSKYLSAVKLFSAPELLEGTNNYSEDNVVGQGPVGRVYKAEFPDGQVMFWDFFPQMQ